MIEFHLDGKSGVPTYLQLVRQVRQAIRLGILRPGDQLPTVKEVVTRLTINPNTVLHAYQQLDQRSLDALDDPKFRGERSAFNLVLWADPPSPVAWDELQERWFSPQ